MNKDTDAKQKLTDAELAQASGGKYDDVPELKIVPLPSFTMDETTVDFQMEVKKAGC